MESDARDLHVFTGSATEASMISDDSKKTMITFYIKCTALGFFNQTTITTPEGKLNVIYKYVRH